MSGIKEAFCLVLLACAVLPGFPQGSSGAERPPAVFELSTDMLSFRQPHAELFLGWQRDVNAAFHVGLDGVSALFGLDQPDRAVQRAGALAVLSGASFIVNQAFSLTAHDQSHMDTARAIGSTNVQLVTDSGRPMSVGEFLLKAFDFTAEPGLYSYDPPDNVTLADEAYVSGAGLNTNLLTAARIAGMIDDHQGYITDLAPYLLNKLWGVHYFLVTGPTSDAANYMDLVAAQGFSHVTETNVIALNAASCLLSGGFLNLVWGTYRYVAEGDPTVSPLGARIGPLFVLLPEMTAWLNPDNVSVNVTVDAWEGSDLLLKAGAEVPALGNTAANPEITLGAQVRWKPVRLGMEVTSNFEGVPFVQGRVEVEVHPGTSVGAEAFYGQGTTMREAREHPLGSGAQAFLRAAW